MHESYHDTPSEAGNNADTLHHVWSITKSVTSMTLGRAWTLGNLNSLDLDKTVGGTFSDTEIGNLSAADPRRNISLHNVLQMRSGLACNENAWLGSRASALASPPANPAIEKDPIVRSLFAGNAACPGFLDILCSILQQPLAYTPGTTWNYNTYDSYLVSAFFSKITGQSLSSYANDHLFTELGITLNPVSDWISLQSPYTFGGGLLMIRSRDLAKLGMLMQYDGKWGDTQLISKEWLDLSLARKGPEVWPPLMQ